MRGKRPWLNGKGRHGPRGESGELGVDEGVRKMEDVGEGGEEGVGESGEGGVGESKGKSKREMWELELG